MFAIWASRTMPIPYRKSVRFLQGLPGRREPLRRLLQRLGLLTKRKSREMLS